MRQTSSGAIPGSRASTEPQEGLGFDPERIERLARQVLAQDPYLPDYLLGWFGLANPQPWGAAMSFSLEVAYGYGFIRGESDATATPIGLAVADRLQAARRDRPNAIPTQPGVK